MPFKCNLHRYTEATTADAAATALETAATALETDAAKLETAGPPAHVV